MTIASLLDTAPNTIPLWPVSKSGLAQWLAGRRPLERQWVEAGRFSGEAGAFLPVPGAGGELAGIVLGVPDKIDLWALADAPRLLPHGVYRLDAAQTPAEATAAALGWALGTYDYRRYREPPKMGPASLIWPAGADRAAVERAAAATFLVRDLVNTPAGDLGPAELAAAASDVAGRFGASVRVIAGDELLAENYPLIHGVGRASPRVPRLIDFAWGQPDHPKVTLVGKGVCFDTGGLDLKPANNMALMKKDMGGAATVLGLAQMAMAAGLPVRLRVLIPAVENAVAGNAYRPGDVLRSRRGLSVEITNTDAEGRLVLADALSEADSEEPDLLIDCATLTGSARVALGPDLPALFTPDDALAADILAQGEKVGDPLWRLPLHAPYRAMLDSKVADLCNSPDSTFAGAVTAALFLREFVAPARRWAHIDLYAWNAKARPGRPVGGEAMAMRALFAVLAARYGGRRGDEG